MADKQLIIEGKRLSKIFSDFWGRPKVTAVKEVDIKVEAGTIFGLLGPNGAGKSTLIKLLLGHLYPSQGTLAVLGKSPRDVDTKKRIGYLPERTAFYANLTALETLLFFGRLLGLPDGETKRRSAQLLKMSGLEQAADRRVGEFSHGMRKRLGLSQALLNDPDLLLLDEPTAGLDPIGCREIKDLILTLGKRGKTVFMTSHLLGDVQDVCEKIMIIYGGQVQSEGSVEELLAKKDQLKIVSEAVPDKTLEKVKKLLEGTKGDQVEVSYPTRTLEEYFLSVVSDAHSRMVEVSGAEMGKGVADYLTGEVDRQALEALSQRPVEEKKEEPAKEEAKVLDQLSKPEEEKPDEEDSGVDRDILDSLTRK